MPIPAAMYSLAKLGLVILEDEEGEGCTILRPTSAGGTSFPNFAEGVTVGAGPVILCVNAPNASVRPVGLKAKKRWIVDISLAGAPANLVFFHKEFPDIEDAVRAVGECYFGSLIDFDALLGGERVTRRAIADRRLQPLRIPTGWTVEFNHGLFEVDPEAKLIDDDSRWMFKEDMLQLTHSRRNRLLDVGWYPDGDLLIGSYKLRIYEGDARGRLMCQFTANDRRSLVGEIERMLQKISNGEF